MTCDHDRTWDVFAVLVNTRGGVEPRVPINLASGSGVAWSPDGARLAYLTRNDAYRDAPRIATALLDGSSVTTVTTGAGDDRDPDW